MVRADRAGTGTQPSVQNLVEKTGSVLALDIGSGTVDALLALPGQRPENWPKFVLPSPARRIGARIREHTRAGRSVWLHGATMGGGFADAVREQHSAGLTPAASAAASASLHDDPAQVAAMGVRLTEHCPAGHAAVHLADYEASFWKALLDMCGLPAPTLVLAAAQDHGRHADVGNREGRFRLWEQLLLTSHGDPARWLFTAPPAAYTRLHSLHGCTGGPVADTAAAAVLGALAVPEIARRSQRQGVTVVNAGNSHTVAFLVYRERVFGVYEHHTALLNTERLLADLKDFRLGWLPDEVIRQRGGHGCLFLPPLPPEAEGFMPTFTLGPQRDILQGHAQFVAPYGDMMVAGCHGLLFGLSLAACPV